MMVQHEVSVCPALHHRLERDLARRCVRLMGLIVGLAFPMMAVSQEGCEPWPAWTDDAINALVICDQPAVERRIGDLCVRHEWRCGNGAFESWLGYWLDQTQASIQLERRAGQLIFSGQNQAVAWALFWAIESEPQPGFMVLLSRMRAQSQ